MAMAVVVAVAEAEEVIAIDYAFTAELWRL